MNMAIQNNQADHLFFLQMLSDSFLDSQKQLSGCFQQYEWIKFAKVRYEREVKSLSLQKKLKL